MARLLTQVLGTIVMKSPTERNGNHRNEELVNKP
jgi:hypothetical protein